MRRSLCVLMAFCSLCVFGQMSLTRYSVAKSVSHTDFVDSIAIEWENQQIYIPVEIEGKTYRFLFDTGSAQAVVYADTPIRGCRPAGHILSHDAIGAVDTVRMVTLPPLKIGSIVFSDCQATLQQRAVKRRGFDGIIGFDIINRGLNAKIDVRNRLLILTDRKNYFDREQGFEARYKIRYHVPYVEVNPFGNYTEEALFDTGSRQFYSMNKQSFDRMAAKVGERVESQVEGRSVGRHAIGNFGAEPLGEVVFLNLSDLRLGDFSFSDVHTVTTQGGSHLGASLLDFGVLMVNPKKRRIRFQPYQQLATIRVGNSQTEIAFVSENGQACVGLVWERGVPYECGFREGDIIRKIDGFPVISFVHFVAWPFLIGREYLFTVQDRQGRQRDIRWVRNK